jgi:hypothetical protein
MVSKIIQGPQKKYNSLLENLYSKGKSRFLELAFLKSLITKI